MRIDPATFFTQGGPGPNIGLPLLGQAHTQEGVIKEEVQVRVMESDGKDDGVKRLVVKLIEQGLSKNRYYYSKKVAESVAALILERPKMNMDHSWGFWGRSFKDLVAIAKESWSKKGASYAIAEMVDNPQTSWLYELAKNFTDQVGASIDARAKIREAEARDGRLWGDMNYDPESEDDDPIYIVEEITFLNSVDFVTYAAAGGQVVELMASQATGEAAREFSQIVAEFQGKVASLINSKPMEEKGMDIKGLTLETLVKECPELVTALQASWAADATKDSEASQEIIGLNSKISEQEQALKEAQENNKSLQIEVDQFQLKEKVTAKQQMIESAIKESGLAAEFISDTFRESLLVAEDEEAVKARIADRLALVESAKAHNGEVLDNGRRASTEGDDPPVVEGDKTSYDEDKLVSEIKGGLG